MDHTHYQELTSQFIDRELTGGEEQELFEHLSSCDECRLFLRRALTIGEDILALKGKAPLISSVLTSTQAVPHLLSHRSGRILKRMWQATIPAPVAFGMVAILVAIGLLFASPMQGTKEMRSHSVPEARAVMSMPTIVIIQK